MSNELRDNMHLVEYDEEKTAEEEYREAVKGDFNPDSRDPETGRFKKGVAPFPKGEGFKQREKLKTKGRNKEIEKIRDDLRKAVPHAVKALVDIVTKPGVSRDRLTAARTILDFCLPKPKESEGKSTEQHMIDLVRALRGQDPVPEETDD